MPFVKRVFSLLIIALLVTCNKNEDPRPCFLGKVITDQSSNEFKYNGERITELVVTIAGGTETTGNVTYDGDGNIAEIDYSDNTREVLFYTNGELTGRKKFSGSNALQNQYDYVYSGNQLTKIQSYSIGGGVAQKSDYILLEYDDASFDPARKKTFYGATATTPTSTSVFTYGTQKDAFSAAPTALMKYLRLGGNPVEKNVVKIVSDNGTTIDYTYEFNGNGYPTKRVETYSNGLVNTRTFSYTCD
jgi:hypothetical protein